MFELVAPTILVIEDSWTDLALIAGVLHDQGYTVISASDPDDALAKALTERPHCIILDVVLPKQSGFQLCRQLKQLEQTQAIPIILISVKNTPVDIRWGLQQGADRYLTKPFQPDELLDSVRSLLGV